MSLLEQGQDCFLDVYRRFQIDVDKGRGVYLYDKTGTCYLDFLSGIAVNALGYNHPAIIEAIKKQLDRNLHLSNYFLQDIQLDLAKKVIGLTPYSKIFLTNSGTEAIEGLLKLIKKWGTEHNKNEIIAFEGSFHGRSIGALSITIQEKHQKSFSPLLPDIKVVPFNDVDAFNNTINEKTAAVFYEGITGEGGIRPVDQYMIEAMARGRSKYGYNLIADEIQTGVGRTGKFYYYEHTDVVPDAISTAKGFGGGLPLGGFLVSEALSKVFNRGEHGTTYGGNPLACASGLAAINIISDKLFLSSVEKRGNYFKSRLYEIADDFNDIIKEIRGQGLMIGVEVYRDADNIWAEGLKQGLIFNIAGGNTLRFLPPLIVDESEIDEAIEKLRLTLKLLFR